MFHVLFVKLMQIMDESFSFTEVFIIHIVNIPMI